MAFKRKIEVLVGPEGGQGVQISDLYIKFEVTKSDRTSMNSASVDIYNLSEKTSSSMCVSGNRLIIRAGYADEGVSSLFFGTIISAETKKEGNDKILHLEAQDGKTKYVGKKISVSFRAGSRLSAVVATIIDVFQLPVVNMNLVPADSEYLIGFSYIGLAKDALTEALSHAGLSWTIQNETIVIFGGTQQATTTQGLLLTSDTGLLSIIPTDDKGNKQTRIRKYTIKTLMYPQLAPGSRCKIQSKLKNIDGIFKIRSGKYTGDNQEGDFITECEVEQV